MCPTIAGVPHAADLQASPLEPPAADPDPSHAPEASSWPLLSGAQEAGEAAPVPNSPMGALAPLSASLTWLWLIMSSLLGPWGAGSSWSCRETDVKEVWGEYMG